MNKLKNTKKHHISSLVSLFFCFCCLQTIRDNVIQKVYKKHFISRTKSDQIDFRRLLHHNTISTKNRRQLFQLDIKYMVLMINVIKVCKKSVNICILCIIIVK